MTVHIALSNKEGAVLLSDSQMSGPDSERHGFQKQCVCDHFVVGAAGDGEIINRVFHFLADHNSSDPTTIANEIETYYATEIRPGKLELTSLIMLTPGVPPHESDKIHLFKPGKFSHFDRPTNFATIGSGSTFVSRCRRYRSSLGIQFQPNSLADLLVEAVFLSEAANESLTVDDKLSVSFIRGNSSYVMGDGDLQIRFSPYHVSERWNEVAAKWDTIRRQAEEINEEIKEAQRLFSNLRIGQLSPFASVQFERISAAIASRRDTLENELDQYFHWYDSLLGR